MSRLGNMNRQIQLVEMGMTGDASRTMRLSTAAYESTATSWSTVRADRTKFRACPNRTPTCARRGTVPTATYGPRPLTTSASVPGPATTVIASPATGLQIALVLGTVGRARCDLAKKARDVLQRQADGPRASSTTMPAGLLFVTRARWTLLELEGQL